MFILARSPAVALLLLLVALPAASEVAPRRPLSGDEIRTMFSGKHLEYRTTRVPEGPPTQPTGYRTLPNRAHIRVSAFLRPDYSISYVCTVHPASGPSHPCQGAGAGRRDVGIWSVEDGLFCTRFLDTREGRKQCYRIIREEAGLRARLASGPLSAMDEQIIELR